MQRHFHIISTQPCADLADQFKQLSQPIFEIFQSAIAPCEPEIQVENYLEGGGWMQFPCTNTIYTYQAQDHQYMVTHCSMYNGHIGDTEETLTIVVKLPQERVRLRVNCYASPYTLTLQATDLSEPEMQALEQLLQAHFQLERVEMPPLADGASSNQTTQEDFNPNDHKNYK